MSDSEHSKLDLLSSDAESAPSSHEVEHATATEVAEYTNAKFRQYEAYRQSEAVRVQLDWLRRTVDDKQKKLDNANLEMCRLQDRLARLEELSIVRAWVPGFAGVFLAISGVAITLTPDNGLVLLVFVCLAVACGLILIAVPIVDFLRISKLSK